MDLYDDAIQAVNHLAQAGRHHLAYIDDQPSDRHVHTERRRGLYDAMQAHNIPIVPEFFVHCHDTIASSRHTVERLLAQWPEIDGMICQHDTLAYGTLEACDQLGITVPDQAAVVGFDDISFSGLQRISLTTLRFPKAEIGRHAAQMLFRRINGELEPGEIVLKTQLIQRGSTPPIET